MFQDVLVDGPLPVCERAANVLAHDRLKCCVKLQISLLQALELYSAGIRVSKESLVPNYGSSAFRLFWQFVCFLHFLRDSGRIHVVYSIRSKCYVFVNEISSRDAVLSLVLLVLDPRVLSPLVSL